MEGKSLMFDLKNGSHNSNLIPKKMAIPAAASAVSTSTLLYLCDGAVEHAVAASNQSKFKVRTQKKKSACGRGVFFLHTGCVRARTPTHPVGIQYLTPAGPRVLRPPSPPPLPAHGFPFRAPQKALQYNVPNARARRPTPPTHPPPHPPRPRKSWWSRRVPRSTSCS